MEQGWVISSDPAPKREEESPHRHESLSLRACKTLGIKFMGREAGLASHAIETVLCMRTGLVVGVRSRRAE